MSPAPHSISTLILSAPFRPFPLLLVTLLLPLGVSLQSQVSPNPSFSSVVKSIFTKAEVISCTKKDFGESSFVCVCNSTQCDYLPGVAPNVLAGQFRVTKSSRAEYRLNEEVLNLADSNVVVPEIAIDLDSTVQYQQMIGFGGAFTDSTGLNILALSPAAQDNVMRTYFGPEGLDYNLARTPIAGSDFSTRPYSYDDVEGDTELVNFALTFEDYDYKLPYIKRAIELTNQDLYLFGSPWSPPAWMKTNGKFNESGELLPEMWQPWSDYFVKFVNAYETELGIEMWGLTTQNEPLSGFDENWGWNTCGWYAEDMRDWIKANLGPTLTNAGLRRVKLMVDDFNRDTLPAYPEPMTSDPDCSQYVDGIAVHWYSDQWVGPEVLDQTHEQSPDKFLLYTEACAGWDIPTIEGSVLLGSWERGESYILNIIDDVNHWSTGWVDWNMALDMEGGPNWADNYVDAPIIINAADDEFYVQPTHAALGMFSRNVKRDAYKISITNSDTSGNLWATAFLNPDGSVAVVLANLADTPLSFGINDETGAILTRTIEAKSWETIVYNRA